MPATIVSLTPAALEADSRTLRIARSFLHFGFRSIVLEGVPSRDKIDFGVSLISMDFRAPLPSPLPRAAGGEAAKGRPNAYARARERLRGGLGSELGNRAVMSAYQAGFWMKYGLKPALKLPAMDLIYLHGYNLYPAAALHRWTRGVPLIYDAHDFYSDIQRPDELSIFDRRYVAPFLLDIERRCCDAASAVITVSEGISQLISETFGCRPYLLRNVHDDRLDVLIESGVRTATGVPEDVFLMVVVGNCKPGQAIAEFLTALKELPSHVHCAFVGRGYEQYQPMARSLGLGWRVHFVGAVPAQKVVPYIFEADAAAILYYPRSDNYRYALPNGFFQSIAAKLPVLVPSALTEVSRLVDQFGCGILIDPLRPESIAEGCRRLLADKALNARVHRGAMKAAEELTWRNEESHLWNIVEPLLGAGRQSQRKSGGE